MLIIAKRIFISPCPISAFMYYQLMNSPSRTVIEGILSSLHRLHLIVKDHDQLSARLTDEAGILEAPLSSTGWWVVAQGDVFDTSSTAQREKVRATLRDDVAATGITLSEHIWVWDNSCRAQLVLGTVSSKSEADQLAENFRRLGLNIAVIREFKSR